MITARFLCILALYVPLCASASPFFSSMMQQTMSTISWEEEEWPHESMAAFLHRCRDYQCNPQLFKKRKLSFSIVEPHHQSVARPVTIDSQTLTDLELFKGYVSPARYVADTLDRTHTEIGRVAFLSLLEPTTDIQVLRSRQELIRYIVDNPEVYHELNDAYVVLAQYEPVLLSFWANDPLKQANERNYYHLNAGKLHEYFNGNAISLALRGMLMHQQRGMWVGTQAVAAVLLPLLGIYTITQKEPPSLLRKVGERVRGGGGILLSLVTLFENKWVQGISSILSGVYLGLATKGGFDWFKANFLLQKIIHEKLIAVASYAQHIKRIEKLLQEHPALERSLPSLSAVRALSDNPVTQELLAVLSKKTFSGVPTLWAHHGNILLAYRLLHEHKQELESALVALGYLDAYRGLATLYTEQRGASFCFAEYLISATPHIELEQFWHPSLSPETAVTNSLTLGAGAGTHGIITGPNAGGKSTIIKAVASSLILAQSVGIVPAARCRITPFTSIQTYLNVPDDIGSGQSLFKAQVHRIGELVNTVEKSNEKEFSFLAIDELFNGTSKEEGESLAYAVGHHLAQFPSVCVLFATHFPLLTQLPDEQESCVNYKVSVATTSEGKLSFPFVLEKGISYQHIAVAIAKEEGFNERILKRAEEKSF